MRSLIVLGVVVLAGCQTTTPQVSSANKTSQFNKFEENCRSAGLVPKTIPFKECVQKSAEASQKPTAISRKRAWEAAPDNVGGGS